MERIAVYSGVILMLFGFVFCDENDELVFAHIIHRHGDRNIVSTYPNDPYKDEKFWPGGYGQLTNIGKIQQYELGTYLRQRYSKLIGKYGSYDPKNIYVQSTDVDRALASAAYTLAGMFPPKDGQIWNEALLWQAIPIHTNGPQEMDHKLAMKRACPRYYKAWTEYIESDEIKSIFEKNRTLLDYVEMHAGMRFKTIPAIKGVYEALWIEELKGFTLPEWTRKVYTPGGDFQKIAHFAYRMPTATILMKRLRVGFLIREMFEIFAKKANATLSPNRSIFIYSAHDITMVNVMRTLNLSESTYLPPYSSCLLFELHRSNGTYHVEIFYKRDIGEDKVPLLPIAIPNCGQKCPLSKLNDIYRDVIPTEDFDTECQLSSSKDDATSRFPQVGLILGFTMLSMLI